MNLNLCVESYNARASLSSGISRITFSCGGWGRWVQVVALIEKATNEA
jgi:hypothetical protein